MKNYLRDYFFVLGDARGRLPFMLMLLMLSAALDVFGLGLIAPLIAAVTNAGAVFQDTPLASLMLNSDGSVSRQAMVTLAAIVVVAFATKGLVAYWVQWTITRFGEMRRRDLMRRLLAAYLAKPYEFHLQRNSTKLINAIVVFTSTYANSVFAGSMRLCADLVMFVAIVGFLAWTDSRAVAVLLLLLAVVFIAYNRAVKTHIQQAGKEMAKAGEGVIRSAADSLGPLREVRILGVEATFVERLHDEARRFGQWSALSAALQTIPRYLVETAMVSFIVLFGVLSVLNGTPPETFIPTLGVFGVAALRLMPASTSVMSGYNGLRQSRYVLGRLAEDLRDVGSAPRIPASRHTWAPTAPFAEVRFDNVSYAYPGRQEPAVAGLNFVIKAGQAVGIIGKTGSGKSTTADLLLGLLQPQIGAIRVDGRDMRDDIDGWMRQLAYIPQSIFLTDDTLRRNIAFGVADAEVDGARVDEAVRASQLQEVVEKLPKGLDTRVGERGVRLSGGQRQRVALARALYHNRELIVMDEATAALDHETEREVVRAIAGLHGRKTLVIIAHRTSTLVGCDAILKLEGGALVPAGVESLRVMA